MHKDNPLTPFCERRLWSDLLARLKDNLIVTHDADDKLLKGFLSAAVSYAENRQKKPDGYYSENKMLAVTEQAVIMLASHFYESRDGSTGGFFADRKDAAEQVWNAVNNLLQLDKEWKA